MYLALAELREGAALATTADARLASPESHVASRYGGCLRHMTTANERRLSDGRVELVSTKRVEASPLYNQDLAPVRDRAAQLDDLQLRGAVDQHGALHSDLHARVGADGVGHELVAGADHDSVSATRSSSCRSC